MIPRRARVWTLLLALHAAPAAATRHVTIAYQSGASPYAIGIADGAIARATGWTIDWRRFDSGASIFAAMAGGAVDLGDVGSSPLAAAASNGLAVRVLYITAGPGRDEQLVVRRGAGIRTIADLRGKRVAAAPVSTDHYMLLALLAQAHLTERDVHLFVVPQPQIVAAWHRGDLDAAFVWSHALDALLKDGTALLTAADAARAGAVTFDAMVGRARFVRTHPDFVRAFIAAIARDYADYRAHPAEWGPQSAHARALAALFGAEPAEMAHELSLFTMPDPAVQASPAWLAGGDASGVARALAATSNFLADQGRIGGTLPSYGALPDPEFVAGLAP